LLNTKRAGDTFFLISYLHRKSYKSAGSQLTMKEYTTPGLQGAGKSQLYDEDLYTDFPVDGHQLNEDLASTPGLAEALRTSQLSRRVPSTSRQQASSAKRSGEVGHRLLGVFEREGHSGRQLTATQRAGYSSVGGHVRIH